MYSVHKVCNEKYGEAIVVFDGNGELSTKEKVHQRRAKGQAGVNVTFNEEMKLAMKNAPACSFLANSTNKQQSIKVLTRHLKNECKVYHASGDADFLIVQKAVESASLRDTTLVGEDTDLLTLYCYHASLDSCNIFFQSQPKKTGKKFMVWYIQDVKEQLGPELCKHILFLHAGLGCFDTTSMG